MERFVTFFLLKTRMLVSVFTHVNMILMRSNQGCHSNKRKKFPDHFKKKILLNAIEIFDPIKIVLLENTKNISITDDNN